MNSRRHFVGSKEIILEGTAFKRFKNAPVTGRPRRPVPGLNDGKAFSLGDYTIYSADGQTPLAELKDIGVTVYNYNFHATTFTAVDLDYRITSLGYFTPLDAHGVAYVDLWGDFPLHRIVLGFGVECNYNGLEITAGEEGLPASLMEQTKYPKVFILPDRWEKCP
jgi:hypothetical protein